MTLTNDDVKRLAELARLTINSDELTKYQHELDAILEYVKILDTVDISQLEPTAQVTGLTNVTRKDEIVDMGVSTQNLLKNAPDQQDDQFKVRRVL